MGYTRNNPKGDPRGKQLLHRGQTPKTYKLLARANGGVYGGSIER